LTREEQNKAIMASIYDAYDGKDESIEGNYAATPDTLLMYEYASKTLPVGGLCEGGDAMLQLGAAVTQHLDYQEFVCEGMVAQGDMVASWGRCTTINRQNGKQTSFTLMHRVVIRDGKLVEGHEFYDSLGLAEDLGLLEETAR
tara:strand:- start:21168 stop:21596 length:429 start_codon:yes stop_codon:yes gene_type:complete